MSIYSLRQMIQQEALKALNSKASTQLGQITGFNPAQWTATVMLYPEDQPTNTPALQTGWLPVFSAWSGSGWGLFAAPNIGDIVEVHYQEGSLNSGYIGLRSFQNNALPAAQAGEFWLVHQSGSMITLTNDGKLSIVSKLEVDLTAPTVNINAESISMGNLSETLMPLMNSAAQSVYNNHIHPVSGSSTLPPNQKIPNSALTTSVKGN